MSSRQIRKLKQQREAEEARLRLEAELAISEEESEEESFAPAKSSMFSAFAGLEDEAGNDDDDDSEDENKVELATPLKPTAPAESESEEEIISIPAKKAKKNKKKKKKKAAKATPNPESDQDIDAALAALNIKAANSKYGAPVEELPQLDPEYERICTLLGINSQHLKVANEMRNLFGRTAASSANEDAGTPRRNNRNRRIAMDLESVLKGRHAPGKGFPELTLRRNLFIAGKDEWPRAPTGGLTMEMVGKARPDGTQEFRYCHDQMYEQTQQQFRIFVEMGDPQNLISLLVRNPYNVSLLIQVSKVAKDQSDHSLSNDLLERALFTMARASTSAFGNALKAGKARLDFSRPENRELWLAGHQYIKSLIMKGTYRTALEWGKLLLELDPHGDPYCTGLWIHHLAYRAMEWEWLVDYACSTLLDPLNYMYYSVLPTKALAHMSLKQPKEARASLREAISRTPFMFGQLFKELNLGDLPAGIWGAMALNNAEELFAELYVRQTKDLWNTPEATSLLMEVAHSLRKDEIDPFLYNSESVNLDVARFVYLDSTPALMALVPGKLLHRQPNSDSDPLPPSMEDNKFSWPSQQQPFLAANGGRENGLAGAMDGHFNPIEALRALIPGFGRQGGEQEDESALQDIRHQLEAAGAAEPEPEVEEAESGVVNAGDERQPRPESHLRRLYQMLFGGGDGAADRSEDHERDAENESGPMVAVPTETDFQRRVREERGGEEIVDPMAHNRWISQNAMRRLAERTREGGEGRGAEMDDGNVGEESGVEGDSVDGEEWHSAEEGEVDGVPMGSDEGEEEFEEWNEEAFRRAEARALERREAERRGDRT